MRTPSSGAKFCPDPPEPRHAFQPRNQTLRSGPETLCSAPKGYPFKVKAVGPDEGLQFFADVPLGRMFQILLLLRSEVMSWPSASVSIQMRPECLPGSSWRACPT